MRRPRSTPAGRPAPRRRAGTILPKLALLMVVLVSFLSLAVDLGMLAIAKAQTQQAADLAALTAARTVNGLPSNNYNLAAATTNAQNVLTYNVVLGQALKPSQLNLTYGSYDYSQTSQTFGPNFPALSGSAPTAVNASVTSSTLPAAFSRVFGTQFLPAITATAQAVHRPRDIALVMDLSGSMRMGTCLGFDFYTTSRASNNPDPVYPTFGAYSSANANLQGPATNQNSSVDNYTISPSNTTSGNSSYTLTYVNNFYQNSAYASPLVRAFDSATSSDGGQTWKASGTGGTQLPPDSYATTPGGDVPPFSLGSSGNYATSVKDVTGGSSRNAAWELDGYSSFANGKFTNASNGQADYSGTPFNGYTQGPGYYGKTFFTWPPDPRQPLSSTGTTMPSSLANMFKQFYYDFGYTTADMASPTIWQPLYGIYSSSSSTPGDRNWPWPNDGGAALGSYLTTNVYAPGSVGNRKLKATDAQYQKIMRLYNWNYAADSSGTTPCDWRVRFFGTNSNANLFNGADSLDLPGRSTYTINYNEILEWVAQDPCPFPSQLRAGRVVYYSAIPTAITGTWPNYGGTDQRFWVEFIDYVLGFRQTSAGVYQDVSGMAGYGSDFTWGNASTTSPPVWTNPGGTATSSNLSMNYNDNPARPQLRYWFGPMAMVDYLQNYNMASNVANYFYMQPGDTYEAPIYTAKQAFVAAINTMQANHPNDWVTTIFYSWPRASANGVGRFNSVRSPLGTNYDYASASLLFPFGTINADGSPNGTELTPYASDPSTGQVPSADFTDVPRADGDTCFAMALMQCYNQFAVTKPTDTTLRSYATSSPINFPSGMAGGQGRQGAQKVVIFETDGLPNCSATAALASAGSYSYYKVRYNMNNQGSSEYPAVTATTINNPAVLNQIYSLITQLSTTYGTSRNPFRLYSIGFGPVFTGANSGAALSTLQSMQYYAGTQSSASTPLTSNQVITGTDAQMSAAMIDAYTSILQNGVQIALIK